MAGGQAHPLRPRASLGRRGGQWVCPNIRVRGSCCAHRAWTLLETLQGPGGRHFPRCSLYLPGGLACGGAGTQGTDPASVHTLPQQARRRGAGCAGPCCRQVHGLRQRPTLSDSARRTAFRRCSSKLLGSPDHPAQQGQPQSSAAGTRQRHREVRRLCQGHTVAALELGTWGPGCAP